MTEQTNAPKAHIAPQNEFTVTDSLGRVLGCKKLTTLPRTKMLVVLGEQITNNKLALSQYVYSFIVKSFDGTPVMTPTKVEHADQILEKLGDEGMAAIADYLDKEEAETVEPEIARF